MKKYSVKCLKALLFLLTAMVVLSLAGCNPEVEETQDEDEKVFSLMNPSADFDGDGLPNKDDPDTDGDGLSNELETKFGTSWYSADTDGDGWSDNAEYSMYDPATTTFHPAIADTPKMVMYMKSAPQFYYIYEAGSEASVTTSKGTETGSEFSSTKGTSSTNTTSMEHGWSAELMAGVEEGQFTGTVTLGASGSYSSEDSYTYSSEDVSTFSSSYSSSVEKAKSNSTTVSGGKVTVPLVFKNPSVITYVASNIQVTLSVIDSKNVGLTKYVCALSPDSENDNLSLKGESESQPIVFTKELTISEMELLMSNPNGIVVTLANYSVESTDSAGTTHNFTGTNTDVAARTARFDVDFGPTYNKSVEQYLVSTKQNINFNAETINDLYKPLTFRQVLEICNFLTEVTNEDGTKSTAIELNDDGSIKSVRGIAPSGTGKWCITKMYTDATTKDAKHVDYTGKSIDDITVSPRQYISLYYSIDEDGDGVSKREELLYGSVDTKNDTDGDTWTDYDEIFKYGTSPRLVDTDSDGEPDNTDDEPLVTKFSTDATLVSFTVNGNSYDVSTTAPIAVVGESLTIVPNATKPASQVTISLNGNKIDTKQSGSSITVNNLLVGDNTILVSVCAPDKSTKKEYTYTVNSTLAGPTNFKVTEMLELGVKLAWDDSTDSRVTGYLVCDMGKISSVSEGSSYTNTPGATSISTGAKTVSIMSLTYNQQYTFAIYACDINGSSYKYSTKSTVTTSNILRPLNTKITVSMWYLYDVWDDDEGAGDLDNEYYWTATIDGTDVDASRPTEADYITMNDNEGCNIRAYDFKKKSTCTVTNVSGINEAHCSKVYDHSNQNIFSATLYFDVWEDDTTGDDHIGEWSDDIVLNTDSSNRNNDYIFVPGSVTKNVHYGDTVSTYKELTDIDANGKGGNGKVQFYYIVSWK